MTVEWEVEPNCRVKLLILSRSRRLSLSPNAHSHLSRSLSPLSTPERESARDGVCSVEVSVTTESEEIWPGRRIDALALLFVRAGG